MLKDNNDMMQGVTCNKSFLFAAILKTSKNKEKTNILVGNIFECSWNERH